MSSLTIRHVTTYRYRQPVAFGEHRMMFRPRETQDQRVMSEYLAITPEPASLDFIQDVFGNHVGIARFAGRSAELRFESTVSVEQSAVTSGIQGADGEADLAPYRERHQADPQNEVGSWASRFLSASWPVGTLARLDRLSHGIHREFRYQRREAKGIQPPVETLRSRQGSCRDFALLMIEAARAFGFAARFASGYLAVPFDDGTEETSEPGRGSTHAWAQIHLPDAGWIDFDPTSGHIGKAGLVTVAVVRDPSDALPLHGTFFGQTSDHLGMEVCVSVTSGAPEALAAEDGG